MENKISEIIELPKHYDPRGSLTVVEQMKNIPFAIKRVGWLYAFGTKNELSDVTSPKAYLLLVALSGSFNVTLVHGNTKRTVMLNHPYQGLLVYPSTQVSITEVSNGAVCLRLSSE